MALHDGIELCNPNLSESGLTRSADARVTRVPVSGTVSALEEAAMREPRFDVLFEPVKIGPVVARNRFYQVPHCNGMGHRAPEAHAAMRGIKAEGVHRSRL